MLKVTYTPRAPLLFLAIYKRAGAPIYVIIDQLLAELYINPEHASVEGENCEGEDAILVVGQVNRSFYEEESNDDDAWDNHLIIKVDVRLILCLIACLIRLVIGTVLTDHGFFRVDVFTLTDGRDRHHHREVHGVGHPSVDCWESHVYRQEVGERNYISPIVFVLERLVDQVLHHDLENNEGNQR